MTILETVARLAGRLDEQANAAEPYRRSFNGETGPVYMTKESRKNLDRRLAGLGVNYPRIYVQSLADRIVIEGFRRRGGHELDPAVWEQYRAAGLRAGSEITHIDYLTYGEAYVTVWGALDDPNRPTVSYDNPRTAIVETDPASGLVTRALRVWRHGDERYAVLLEPDTIRRFKGKAAAPTTAPATWVADGDPIENQWGEVPTVRFCRRLTADEYRGQSAISDLVGLGAAHSKVLQDAIVTSEHYARPRRWVTGLEIEYDDEGNPIDPFGDNALLQSESPETKFGQFDAARLDFYAALLDTLTASVAAVTNLPPHYLGIHADQPANAESIKAAEAPLVAQALTEMNRLESSWGRVAGWLLAIATGAPTVPTDLVPRFDSAETRTPAQAADAAQKLASIGIPLRSLLDDPLRLDPNRIAEIMAERESEALQRAAFDMGGR